MPGKSSQTRQTDQKSNHTPGPWEVSADGIWAKSPFGARVKIATVTSFSPMNGIDSHANAQTIGAGVRTATERTCSASSGWKSARNCERRLGSRNTAGIWLGRTVSHRLNNFAQPKARNKEAK